MSLALSSCHLRLRPRPGLGQASVGPRAGLDEPRSASNANKPASSWPLRQGRKKCSKHGCDRGASTVRPSTQPSQPLPELSHFYHTQAQKQGVLLMSLWFLLVCDALTQNMMRSRQLMFLPTSQKRSKTHVVTKSLYIKTWFVCLNKFECLKNVETFQAPKHGS